MQSFADCSQVVTGGAGTILQQPITHALQFGCSDSVGLPFALEITARGNGDENRCKYRENGCEVFLQFFFLDEEFELENEPGSCTQGNGDKATAEIGATPGPGILTSFFIV